MRGGLRVGRPGPEAVPVGYGVGVIGVLTFMVGGLGDQVWHLSLGVEQDINAFQSPTHWLLAIGMFLMLSSGTVRGIKFPGSTTDSARRLCWPPPCGGRRLSS